MSKVSFAYCKKVKGGEIPAAQDLCQEVLLRVWKRINSPEWTAKLSMAYLTAAANNVHITHLRKHPPGMEISLSDGSLGKDTDFDDGVPALNALSLSRHQTQTAEEKESEIAKSRLEKLGRAIRSCLPVNRDDLRILKLTVEGKSDQEIAEILHWDRAAVTYRRQLMIKKVKYRLGQQEPRLK